MDTLNSQAVPKPFAALKSVAPVALVLAILADYVSCLDYTIPLTVAWAGAGIGGIGFWLRAKSKAGWRRWSDLALLFMCLLILGDVVSRVGSRFMK